jgi:signal transduction histidine kinase
MASMSLASARGRSRWTGAGPLRLVFPYDRRVRYAAGVLSLVVLYYATAHLGFALEFAGPVAAIVWLPVGVGIAFLYLGGAQFWPGVLIGDLLVNNYSALPAGVAVAQTCGNLAEVVGAAVLMRYLIGRVSPDRSVSRLCRFVIAFAAGTAISAIVGCLSLLVSGVITTAALPRVFRAWWLGDFCGALLVVPLIVSWSQARHRWRWPQHLEAILVLVALAATSEIAWHTTRPLAYVVFPVLIWSAFRLGMRGATSAVVVAAAFSVSATTNHIGPFMSHSLTRGVLETQLFIAVASLLTLCLASVLEERQEFSKHLWESRVRLVVAADTERRRLEQNLHDGAQQRLAALMVRLGLVAEMAPEDPGRAQSLFDAARSELAVALEELRELSHGHNPPVLVRHGLAASIRDVAEHSIVPIEIETLPSARLPERTEATAYYVFAEAAANAQKHARATSIRVRVELARGLLHLEVADDGIGGAAENDGSGVQGMRDRVEALGGSLRLDSPRGRGTVVAAVMPVDAPLVPR